MCGTVVGHREVRGLLFASTTHADKECVMCKKIHCGNVLIVVSAAGFAYAVSGASLLSALLAGLCTFAIVATSR